MKRYDFDSERVPAACSAKWHFHKDDKNIIEFWLADMDFKIMPFLQEEIKRFVDGADLGYAFVPETYFESVMNWNNKYSEIACKKEWIIPANNSIMALCAIIQSLTEKNDNIAFFTPSYHAFAESINRNNREVIDIPLHEENGKYNIDFEEIIQIIDKCSPRLLILCNPHNPTGRMFQYDELMKLIGICKEKDIVILGDEIHQDITFEYKHISLINFADEYDKLIVINSPTKSFNIAGVKIANIIVPNAGIRELIGNSINKNGAVTPNSLGIKCCEVCYNFGEEWIRDLLSYIEENRKIACEFFEKYSDSIEFFCPEGTYFLWLKALFPMDDEFSIWLFNNANIRLERGGSFGERYKKYARLTLACRTVDLKKGLERIQEALKRRVDYVQRI